MSIPIASASAVERSGTARTTVSCRDTVRRTRRGAQERTSALGTFSSRPSRAGTTWTASPYTAKPASFGGRPTLSESLRKYVSAVVPPMASLVAPARGRLRSRAIRQRGNRKLRRATTSVTGAEIARRARSAAPVSISAVTGGAVTRTGSAVAPGVRSSCPSARTTTSAAASRSRRLPPAPARPGCGGRGARERHSRPSIHVVGDLVEHVLERGVRDRERGQHLRAEDASANAAEASERAEAVTGSRGGVDGGAPVGCDAELVRRKRVRLGRRDELDGSSDRCSKSASSLAIASRFVRPPTSTPATWVPDASSLGEPANARPTRIASTAAAAPSADQDRGERARTAARASCAACREATRRASKREF